MNGVGPLEPGEGTQARDGATPLRPRGRLEQHLRRHRRAAVATAATAAVLAGGGHLYATRPQPEPPAPPPYPAQAVSVEYLGPDPAGGGTPADGFRFAVRLTVRSGPPVTLTRLGQPSPGLSVTSEPAAPFPTKRDSPRKITVTLRVTECGKAPRNAGLPFLDVTLRNTRAIQVHSYILGDRYAQDLSEAVRTACDNDSV
ncbi:Tat pathway signal sequence domain protein [Streptomyces poriticola]|uniref:Tat pathway signal sequence domain protein n=1 Tax=Streptomyces poriticola TaxID=3120506 RepID=UPI002FCE47FF